MAQGALPRKHLVIPDTQTRPGVPLDHLDWVGRAIVDYKPDVVVHIGDHWDFPSLNGHDEPGSAPLEGKRYADDLAVGDAAFAQICAPIDKEMARIVRRRRKKWDLRKIFCVGNHEGRADRCATNNPKFLGTIGSDQCNTRDWERHEFLEVVEVDGFLYSHFFQSSHSDRPIGGTVQNKLSKIGSSFVHGHVQGLDMGTKIMGNGKTWWGISAGSCYLHLEDYRGAQGQKHFRGIIILHEAEDGECCPMPVSLKFLCRKYTGLNLFDYMVKKYPGQDWRHLK